MVDCTDTQTWSSSSLHSALLSLWASLFVFSSEVCRRCAKQCSAEEDAVETQRSELENSSVRDQPGHCAGTRAKTPVMRLFKTPQEEISRSSCPTRQWILQPSCHVAHPQLFASFHPCFSFLTLITPSLVQTPRAALPLRGIFVAWYLGATHGCI